MRKFGKFLLTFPAACLCLLVIGLGIEHLAIIGMISTETEGLLILIVGAFLAAWPISVLRDLLLGIGLYTLMFWGLISLFKHYEHNKTIGGVIVIVFILVMISAVLNLIAGLFRFAVRD